VFFGQHRRSPVDAASRRRGMLQVRNGCAGFRAQSESRDWPMHRGNTGGIDSFLVVRRHTNTDNITDSSHSNDTLYSVRKYRCLKLFRHFLW